MILSKFTKREQILIFISAIVVFSTVLYGVIIEPLATSYSNLNRQIASNSLKLERNYKMISREDFIKREHEKYANLIKPLPADEEEIASMLKIIEAIARKNNIFITNIRPQPLREKAYYKELTFELIAEADIKQLVKFIYDLQSSGNLLRVKKISISSTSAGKKNLKAVMEITKPAIEYSEV